MTVCLAKQSLLAISPLDAPCATRAATSSKDVTLAHCQNRLPRIIILAVLATFATQVIAQCCDPTAQEQCESRGWSWLGMPDCRCETLDSPIIIDLDRNGLSLTSVANGVMFDINGSGRQVPIAWTAPGALNAFLALDRNANGVIDNGTELFGNFIPQSPSDHPNGFLALNEFDKRETGGDGDGIIDEHDSIFASLRLWIDSNHNAVSEPSELFTLPALGVHSLSLAYQESRHRDRFGNMFRYRAKVNVDQSKLDSLAGPWAYDIFLARQDKAKILDGPLANPPGTIDGAKTPGQIPLDTVYNIFLRVASCPPAASSLQLKKCSLVRHAVGLDSQDEAQLEAHLASFLSAVLPLDEQIASLGRSLAAINQPSRAVLIAQRQQIVREKVAALRQNLSSQGMQQFDAYIAKMKTKIRLVPASTTVQ